MFRSFYIMVDVISYMINKDNSSLVFNNYDYLPMNDCMILNIIAHCNINIFTVEGHKWARAKLCFGFYFFFFLVIQQRGLDPSESPHTQGKTTHSSEKEAHRSEKKAHTSGNRSLLAWENVAYPGFERWATRWKLSLLTTRIKSCFLVGSMLKSCSYL